MRGLFSGQVEVLGHPPARQVVSKLNLEPYENIENVKSHLVLASKYD